ncbi:MAG: PDZ domain-containing protein [Verrucomicrobiota bacterium]
MKRTFVSTAVLCSLVTFASGQAGQATEDSARQAWLGIATNKLPEILYQHLDIPTGSGLAVDYVAPGSPAERGGLQKDDILVRLDEQLLINPEQLSVLVRQRAVGSTATLEVLRKKEPLSLQVEFGSLPPAMAEKRPLPSSPSGGASSIDQLLEEFLGEDLLGDALDRLRQEGGVRGVDPLLMDQFQSLLENRLGEVLPPSGPGVHRRVMNFDGEELLLQDQEGSIKVFSKEGKKWLEARDGDNEVVFSGPYETEEEKAKVPEALRDRLGSVSMAGGDLSEQLRQTFQFQLPPVPAVPEGEGEGLKELIPELPSEED